MKDVRTEKLANNLLTYYENYKNHKYKLKLARRIYICH